MYYCPNCGNDSFVTKKNRYGDLMEICTICKEEYIIDDEDDEETEED